jgi:hypothetical protein
MQETREENVRLQTTVEFTEQQRSALQDQVTALLIQVQELSERVGREYSKGYLDALREKGEHQTAQRDKSLRTLY